MKKIALIICAIMLLGGAVSFKMLKKVLEWKNETEELIALGFESQCTGSDFMARSDSAEHHLLCLGNSITLHYPASTIPGADPFWRGEWGMCASRRDSDYVHRLEKLLQKTNAKSTVVGENIAAYERDFSLDLDSLIGKLCQGKDIIILKIGENVIDTEGYYKGFKRLADYCLRFTPHVYIAGSYWKNVEKERAMVSVARECHLPYIPLFWIDELYRDQTNFKVGDTIYDIKGTPYPIATDFIITHPNDKGMQMIADAIYVSMMKYEQNNKAIDIFYSEHSK